MGFNPNLPLGLPDGSVRSIIALWFSGVTGFLWATGQPVPNELLIVTTGFVSYYLAQRGQAETAKAVVAEAIALPPPYIPPTTQKGA